MYLKLTQLSESILPFFIFMLAAAFAGSVVGLYCQEWGISGSRADYGWNVRFNFKYLYVFRYKALDLGGITSLSLTSESRSTSSRRPSARLNTLSAETADGKNVEVTHLIPYGLPAPIGDFIVRVNARLSDPTAQSFDEKLVFNPLKLGDIFLYVFGAFFVVIMLLFAVFASSLVAGLVAPAFIRAGAGQVEYRTKVFTGARSVPFHAIANFEASSQISPGDVPGWLAKATGGEEKLAQMLKERPAKSYPPNLVMNLKDGTHVSFYSIAKEEAKARELAEELNRAIGAEVRK